MKAAGGQVLEEDIGVKVGGWAITSRQGHITSEQLPPPAPNLPELSPPELLLLVLSVFVQWHACGEDDVHCLSTLGSHIAVCRLARAIAP